MARIKNPMVRNFLKGACVGGSMLVPGVSGGTMAMILGVYDRLISAVSSFTKNVRENAAFLGIFALGAAAGMLLFARPILMLIEAFPMTMRFFFIGAVAGGVPLMVRRARVRDRALRSCIYTAFGLDRKSVV